MLTKKQHALLTFIEERLADSGVSPSFDEMKDALGLKSKSGIHRLITALEERGFIRRLPHRARALEILKSADGNPVATNGVSETRKSSAVVTPSTDGRAGRQTFKPAVVDGGLAARRGRGVRNPRGTVRPSRAASISVASETPAQNVVSNTSSRASSANGPIDLPVLGRIAAGTPIDAIQHEVDRIEAPAALLGAGEHYILEVQGESMIEAGINDGDFAIIQRCADGSNGEIVVALVDGQEATLKRLRKKGASIALEAANPAFETRIYGHDRVAVQGKLVGLMRKY
ncbi:MAG: transcriptional repressor LexA [Pseudomonadota bacterium]